MKIFTAFSWIPHLNKAFNLYLTPVIFSYKGDLLEEIRLNANKGMAIGHDRFKKEIEKLTGRRLKPQKAGRPVGWRKKKDGI